MKELKSKKDVRFLNFIIKVMSRITKLREFPLYWIKVTRRRNILCDRRNVRNNSIITISDTFYVNIISNVYTEVLWLIKQVPIYESSVFLIVHLTSKFRTRKETKLKKRGIYILTLVEQVYRFDSPDS